MVFIVLTISSYTFYKYLSNSAGDEFPKTVAVLRSHGLICELYWSKNRLPAYFEPRVESGSLCHNTSDTKFALE